jgi:hypothetical protein
MGNIATGGRLRATAGGGASGEWKRIGVNAAKMRKTLLGSPSKRKAIPQAVSREKAAWAVSTSRQGTGAKERSLRVSGKRSRAWDQGVASQGLLLLGNKDKTHAAFANLFH